VLDPEVVAVVGSGQGGEARVVFELSLVDAVDVEWRVGHHEVEAADAVVEVLVVAVALADLAGQPVDGEVHFC
jgi:hypothetical protein